MTHGLIVKKIAAWASLPILPILGTFALLWLYLAGDDDDSRSRPYSF
jgi:hypothetical protein